MDIGFELVGMIVGAFIGLIVFFIYIATVVWAYSDGNARGKSGCLVALLVALLSWPIGLLIWIVLRPNKYGRG